jgi:hypothetical protein
MQKLVKDCESTIVAIGKGKVVDAKIKKKRKETWH